MSDELRATPELCPECKADNIIKPKFSTFPCKHSDRDACELCGLDTSIATVLCEEFVCPHRDAD